MTENKKMRPIVFCNIGWCRDYLGDESNDPLVGGGSYVREHGSGNEDMNFLPIYVLEVGHDEERAWFLGSFETKHNRGSQNQTHIEKIRGCGALRKENHADGVTVVWCAKNPEGKTCVVGWYQNATIGRFYEILPMEEEDGSEWERWYNVRCRYEDATLLPVETRRQPEWIVPRHTSSSPVPFGFGQSNIWYALEPEAEDFVTRMISQIENYSGEDMKFKI